ncbi:MAG TPA: hypothetical protein VMW24_18445 [Sedimentisphaerales bacterium]|nr:hypothetical protein [Sedimentisphaerales bacterium]
MKHDKNANRSGEKEAVFTTIVGGRPPGSGTGVGDIPRAIEVLVKKASVDPAFRELFLKKRAEAAKEIDLDLTEAERNMLASISEEQLQRIIANTKVKPEHRNIFLGTAGKLMLAIVAGLVIASVMTPTLGHTLTPEQRERIFADRAAHLRDMNDVNEPKIEMTRILGHTLTPEQRDHFLRLRMAQPSDTNNVNEPNDPDTNVNQAERRQTDANEQGYASHPNSSWRIETIRGRERKVEEFGVQQADNSRQH